LPASVPSKKEKQAVDAIFSYLDTVTAAPDHIAATDAIEPAAIPQDSSTSMQPHSKPARIEGNVFEYRYRVSPKANYISFFWKDDCVMIYALQVEK
jgi:hypothetical protein